MRVRVLLAHFVMLRELALGQQERQVFELRLAKGQVLKVELYLTRRLMALAVMMVSEIACNQAVGCRTLETMHTMKPFSSML